MCVRCGIYMCVYLYVCSHVCVSTVYVCVSVPMVCVYAHGMYVCIFVFVCPHAVCGGQRLPFLCLYCSVLFFKIESLSERVD